LSAVLGARLTTWRPDPPLERNDPSFILFFTEQRRAALSAKVNLAANQQQAPEGLSLCGIPF
jgi:hypothetical protein